MSSTRLKVLIVNQSPTFRYNLMVMLGNRNYQFFQASTGRHAIESARVNQPQLIVMDNRLGDMDGIECLRQIRNIGAFGGTRIIMLRREILRDDLFMPEQQTDFTREAHRLGCSDFVSIPVSPTALLRKVDKLEHYIRISAPEMPPLPNIAPTSLTSPPIIAGPASGIFK